MFNKNVIDVLSQVNAVTNSIILKYPTTIAVSESQDIMMSIPVDSLDSDSFPTIGLKDSLSDFLSLFKLFADDRSVTVSDNTINVTSGKTTSCYISDNVALMEMYDKSPDQFTKTEEAPSVAVFELSSDDIKNIKSASGVFKDLNEVIFTTKDSDMNVSLGATNKFNAKSNTYTVSKESNNSKQFDIKVPVENFKMIPVTDYKIEVKYNSARDSYRMMLFSKNIEGLNLLMSTKV